MARVRGQEYKLFGDIAEQLTTYIYNSLIGTHGPYFIERVYLCKGYSSLLRAGRWSGATKTDDSKSISMARQASSFYNTLAA